MAKTLELVINAAYKGSAAFKKAKADINAFGKGAVEFGDKFKKTMGNIGTALLPVGVALGAVTVAAKGAWNTLQEGAALELARSRFENLSESIGTTADSLLGKLRDATNGMMSDAALMASATDMMSLGLAKTEEQAVRMTTVVGKLGWDMQQVVLTMANNSKMRLDALGLSVEDVNQRVEKLVATGMTMDEAFDLAVIEAGEAKIELMGDAANTTAGQINILQAAAENAGNAFKESFARELADNVRDMAGSAEDLTEQLVHAAEGAAKLAASLAEGPLGNLMKLGINAELTALEEEFARLGGVLDSEFYIKHVSAIRTPMVASYDEMKAAVVDLRIEVEKLQRIEAFEKDQGLASQRAQEAAAQGLRGTGAAALDAAGGLSEWTDEAKKAAIAAANFNPFDPSASNQEALWRVAGAHIQGILDEFAAEAAEAEDEIAEANRQAAEEAARAWEEYAGRVAGAFTTAIAGLQDEEVPDLFSADGASNADAINEAIYNMGVSAGGTAGQLAELGVATGQFNQDVADAAIKAAIFQGALEILSKEWKIGAISTDEFINSVNQVVADLENNTVIELDAKIADKADGFQTPVRVPVQPDWIEGDPTALTGAQVKVPVELTLAENALQQAMNAAAPPAEDLTQEIVFTANTDAITGTEGAIPTVVSAVTDAKTIFTFTADAQAILATGTGEVPKVVAAVNDADPYFEFFANDDDVWDSINAINNKRLKVYVDYIPSSSGPAGGASSGGGAPSGGGGNSGWGGWGGFNANMNVTFNGPAEPRAVTRAVRSGLEQFYADLARVGVMR